MAEPVTPWEKVATTRWGTYVSRLEKQAILDAQALAGPPSSALEIGCEGGRWSRLLTDLGWSMTCIDVNPVALAEVRRKIPNAECIQTTPDAKTIPRESKSVSLLLCIEVAPVIFSDWFLPEARRVLKDNGVLLSVVWNKTSIRALLSRICPSSDPDSFYKRSYREWKRGLLQSGFRSVRDRGMCWAPFGRSSNSALIPLFTSLEAVLGMRRIIRFSPWVVSIAQKVA